MSQEFHIISTNAEQPPTVTKDRINSLQRSAAHLFAHSLILSIDQPDALQEKLAMAQKEYFEEFLSCVPVHVSGGEILNSLDMTNEKLLIVANHPPYEKTISPTPEQLREALVHLGRSEIFDILENRQNLPAGIARRAILHGALQTVLHPGDLRYHVVGAQYRPPLDIVQQEDGTIIVPYAEKGMDGFGKLTRGIERVYTDTNFADKHHVIVAFPEGEQPIVIEQLKPFHSGIFAAAALVSGKHTLSIRVLPVVIATREDLSVDVQILPTLVINPSLKDPSNASLFARSLQTHMQDNYTRMLQSMGNYFWKGQTYPFGGLTRDQIRSTT